MARKYLNDLGVDDTTMNLGPKDKRWRRWNQQKRIYGFPDYETYQMDYTFYCWLYEHLMMYLEVAKIIDLDVYKFAHDGKEYTQREMIDAMIDGCEIAITEAWEDMTEEERKKVTDVPFLWAEVIPVMNW